MRRREIRLSVDLALAENGYSQSFYAWKGAHLYIYAPDGHIKRDLHFPSGLSRKRFIECVSTLPVMGPPRACNNYSAGAKEDRYRQADIEDAIRDAR